MKKILINKILIVLVILNFSLFSCSDDFLEEVPTESISEQAVATTTGNLFLVINGIHRSLYIRYDSNGRAGAGSLMIQNDALGEDFVMTGEANKFFIQMAGWSDHTDASDSYDLYPYRFYYRIIRNANVVINGVGNAEGPEIEKNTVLGEALIYRAWSHFQLVQLYGERYDASSENTQLGVPIRLTTDNNPITRNTVKEVYTQIHTDLDQAIKVLEDYSRANKSHLDKSIALGIKARVALVQQDYTTAASYANQARSGYSLMSRDDYYANFNNYENIEWMWGSHIQEDQVGTFSTFGAYVSRNFSSSNIRGNPKAINNLLYDKITSTDIRSKLFDPTGQHDSLPPGHEELSSRFSKKPYTSQKFLTESTGSSKMDVPYMRAAEMYLIEAEALSYSNESQAKQVLFELASNRDPNYTLSTNSGSALKEEIYIQRRVELWGEGFRFYDLKRLNIPLDRIGTNHTGELINYVYEVPAGDNRWQWLIPQDALNANPLLEQNPI
ncbi:RagB/SusD family nutrient uptake outer membrane protein [Joostella atrarenae]|uniref:RagB/SusD family nutrient uptake outer membrane protein n=1 Tax=Joostella atrarenae TaxID=679257 RepID=A0ABS9IYX1_9FLAO|nr:RagB/SusD family nutrient uptake outer membrane protein [Joostella atrarenae]MCF8713367.1 RagB/SusD family nutrient uptake outer membrane protein [Joostella atrarenae]